jgi:Uncharacterised nucleotidyltransferase
MPCRVVLLAYVRDPICRLPGNNKNTHMNLISMSVWGDQPIYWEGAVANAQLHHSVYPGWRLRFYTDTENGFTRKLKEHGCEVRVMENLGGIHGMFWRFLPVSEPGLGAVIVRDADSLLNSREAAAVAAWLASGKAGHVMRDHPQHLSWPMLGGMWGVRGGVIADMEDKIRNWGRWRKKYDDQYFLKDVVWPLIANDCVQHTSGYSRWGGEPFPPHGPSASDYVGQSYCEPGRRGSSSRSAVNRVSKKSGDGGTRQALNPELELLLACIRALSDRAAEAAIRQILADFADWPFLARKAVDHESVVAVAHALARTAADLVPDDILDALRSNRDQTHTKNCASFDELARLVSALASAGVEAIPFGGPIIAIQAYGDLGIRTFGDLDLLIRRPEALVAAKDNHLKPAAA